MPLDSPFALVTLDLAAVVELAVALLLDYRHATLEAPVAAELKDIYFDRYGHKAQKTRDRGLTDQLAAVDPLGGDIALPSLGAQDPSLGIRITVVGGWPTVDLNRKWRGGGGRGLPGRRWCVA